MKRHFWFLVFAVAAPVAFNSFLGCKPKPERTQSKPAASANSGSATAASGAATSNSPVRMPKEVADQLVFRVLVGPQLLIQPGKGLGPIRFGATQATIERLMDGKPTEVVQSNNLTVLRYQAHATEFTLQDGAVVKMYVHGNEREFVPGKGPSVENVYGIFNGAFSNGGKLGMYENYTKQGTPKQVEQVQPGRFPTVERHHYDNLILEYDKLKNGNVVLAGVILTKPGWTEPATP